MARITDSLLIQRVDGEIVFIDEIAGEEVAFPLEAIPTMLGVLQYFHTVATSVDAPDWTLS